MKKLISVLSVFLVLAFSCVLTSFADNGFVSGYAVDDVLNELKNGVKRTVYLSSQVLDFCSEQDPTIFDGWEVVLTDEKADVSLTEMPKNLDGYKDETNEEYIQRIKNKTEEIRHNEKTAVIEAESNEEIEQILRRL